MSEKPLNAQAEFYDEADLEATFDMKNAKLIQPTTKRINLNVTEQQVALASKLGVASGNGYQNVLKIAISIGLKNLEEKILR